MFSALFVLVLSSVMVVSGRKLMRQGRHSRIEGIVSCIVGLALAASWYDAVPSDFSDLADFLLRMPGRMMSADGVLPYTFVVAVPAAIAMILMLVVYRSDRKDPNVVKNIFGPLGRIRRPKFLR